MTDLHLTRPERLLILRRRRAMSVKRLRSMLAANGCHVNISTLSVALNNGPRREIGDATRERILAACEALLEEER